MKAFKLRHRVTRTRVKVGKLPEFERLQRPLWIRRVLVGLRPPTARAQEGQLLHTTREASLGSRQEAVAQNSPTQGGREVFALGMLNQERYPIARTAARLRGAWREMESVLEPRSPTAVGHTPCPHLSPGTLA
jgi:hypothetical protein